MCNYMVSQFLLLCEELGILISLDKTEWASELIVFLGILLNGRDLSLSIPVDKRDRAIELLMDMKNRKKSTVKELQKLCGYLNFLCKVIFPGQTFIRRMHAKFSTVINVNGVAPKMHMNTN